MTEPPKPPPDRSDAGEAEEGEAPKAGEAPQAEAPEPSETGSVGEQPVLTQAAPATRGSPGATAVGAILVALGIVFLVGQQLNIDIGDITWPFYVIAAGVALLVLGLTQVRGSGLAVAGSVIGIVGLVLLYQNTSNHWESWAYAWALVGPGGSGLGMLLYGARSGDRAMARAGFWQAATGIALFGIGFVIFEGVIGISGERLPLPDWLLPAALVAIGVVVLVRGLTARRDLGSGRS